MKTLGLKQKSNKALTFLLSLVKEEERFKILYFSLLIISSITLILGFEWSLYILWWLLGFGWSLFFFKKHLNLLEHFLLSGVVFTSIFIVYICLFAIINIPVNIYFFLGFGIISIIVFLKSDIFKDINLKISNYDYLILFLFFVALVAKVFPLRNYFAAPLHDPISHSMMAKDIVETGLIEYFYSPGLHILSAFGDMAGGFFVSKQVMLLSVFFSAYSGIIAYVFIKRFFKDKIWGLVTAMLFSVGYYPAMLTFNAGKNSLIMGLTILFFLMFTTTEYLQNKNKKIILITAIAVASLFLIHYPVAVLGCLFLAIIYLLYFNDFKWKGFLSILGILFGLAWAARSYKYQIEQMSLLVNPERTSISYGYGLNSIEDKIKYYITSIWGSIKANYHSWNKYPLILSTLGILILPIKAFFHKVKRLNVILLWILFLFLFFLLLSILDLSILTILFETYLLTLPIYFYFLCGFFLVMLFNLLLSCFNKQKSRLEYMLQGFLIASMLIMSYTVYGHSKNFITGGNYVQQNDINAFNWINENISDEEKIIINSYQMNNVVYSSDAGGYLEVFTGNTVSTPFYEFNTKRAINNQQLYELLQEDINNCLLREEFIKKGYNYYYQGSYAIYSAPLGDKNDLVKNQGYEIIFEDGTSTLFKILGCD